VLPFDEPAASTWARLLAHGQAKGRPRSPFDTIIAAVAEANGCAVVTDNERNFADIEIINPLRGSSRK
jgi:toxin FitB